MFVDVKSRFALYATCVNYFCWTTIPFLPSQTVLKLHSLGVGQRNYRMEACQNHIPIS